ncbi:MAG: hypothetical protein KKC46_13685 [Proteobacteria bacterium]|nr:hypothetical protein [Pseudomonadota bacterium]
MHKQNEIERIDIVSYLNEEPSLRTGNLGLWFRVFIDCFFTIRDGGDPEDVKSALAFFAEDNLYFDILANELGYDANFLRSRVFKALNMEKI